MFENAQNKKNEDVDDIFADTDTTPEENKPENLPLTKPKEEKSKPDLEPKTTSTKKEEEKPTEEPKMKIKNQKKLM